LALPISAATAKMHDGGSCGDHIHRQAQQAGDWQPDEVIAYGPGSGLAPRRMALLTMASWLSRLFPAVGRHYMAFPCGSWLWFPRPR